MPEPGSIVRYAEARFEIRPYPTISHLSQIARFVTDLGYKFPFSWKQYSIDDVQDILLSEGPNAFMKRRRLQEDISPKAAPQTAADFVGERLARLARAQELLIIDPFLFPSRLKGDEHAYTTLVASLIDRIVNTDSTVHCFVNTQSNTLLQNLLSDRLKKALPKVSLEITHSDDFHDRFWIADRTRGVVVGTSLNGIGGKIFFIDELRRPDVDSIIHEIDAQKSGLTRPGMSGELFAGVSRLS